MPIFEFKFRKLGIFQPEKIEQPEAESFSDVAENLVTVSPTQTDTLIVA